MPIVINRNMGRTAMSLAVPGVLVLAALAVAFGVLLLPRAVAPIIQAIPYVVLGLGVILGTWFHRSRTVFGLMFLLPTHWVLSTWYLNQSPDLDVMGQVAYAAICVLLPINLAVFAFLDERGLFTERGISRLAAIGLQIFAIVAVVNAQAWLPANAATGLQAAVADALHFRLLPKDFDWWTYLPQPALLAFAITFVILLARLVRKGVQPVETGYLAAAVAAALALHFVGKGQGPAVLFATAGLVLTVAVVQDSYRMAFLDELTGLPGRRALQTDMMKLGKRYTMAMLDVDHFKKFNDTYGHDVGDQVLRMVAARMGEVSGGGRSFRYGGEEFTVLFPGKDVAHAMVHLERLRKSIEASSFALRGDDRPDKKPDEFVTAKHARETVSVTISIGVAGIGEPSEEPLAPDGAKNATQPDEVLKAADQALYRAKEGGRNRVST